jgi:hypothetical protein
MDMARRKPVEVALDEQQEVEAQRIYERLGEVFDEERMRIARCLASKANRELLGQTEFEIRDRVHALGAQALEAAAEERQKKGWVRGC